MTNPSPRLAKRLRFRRVENEGVLVDQAGPSVLVVNGVGVRVLEMIRDDLPYEEIVASLAAEFEVDVPTAETDLRAYLEDLERRGLLEVAEG